MAVGDINSDAPGSGARFNDGKLAMDLIPVSFWVRAWDYDLNHRAGGVNRDVKIVLHGLERFQEGNDGAPAKILEAFGEGGLRSATRVLEFGAKKYAAWNWAKGMNWSVPTGCILRHSRAILVDDEDYDPESDLPHFGHILCNVVMLDYFTKHYPEGDDRPPHHSLIVED